MVAKNGRGRGRMCKSCHGCQVVGQYLPPELMHRSEPLSGPWQDLAADIMKW